MVLAIPLQRGREPLFRQIYAGLREAIVGGAFRAGDTLPSTRALADHLRVSRTVVLLAYEQLLAEGFVTGKAGSGTYVAEGFAAVRAPGSDEAPPLRLSRFGAAAASIAQTARTPAPRALRFDFAYGPGDLAEFPFAAWRRLLVKQDRQSARKRLGFGDAAGSGALREAIAAHLRRARAVRCDPAQILVVNGSQQALDLIARVLIEPGDRVAIEDPHYLGAREVLRAAGATILPTPVDADGVDPARLADGARLAFVTPSHQFPTGAVLPLARRLALLDWAEANDAILVEDDYDGEFRYEGQPLESLQGLDRSGRVIYVGTFSRTIFPSLRIGYLVAPPILVAAFTAAKWLSDRRTASLEQETLAAFITGGLYERYLRRVRRRNAERRTALLSAIAEHLSPTTRVTGDGAGAHIALWPGGDVLEAEIVRRAAELDVGVFGVAPYFLGTPRPGLLLGYAQLSVQDIREGIARLGAALRR